MFVGIYDVWVFLCGYDHIFIVYFVVSLFLLLYVRLSVFVCLFQFVCVCVCVCAYIYVGVNTFSSLEG